MTSRVAIALCLILSLSGVSLASGPQPGSTAAQDAGATDETANPSAPSSADEATGDTTDETESEGKESAPIDVHRHRPGACPEGPPCKDDD